jgi:hypothetical protein
VVKIAECGGRVTGLSGLIASTHYPLAYPAAESCSWSVTGLEGHSLSFKFLDFRLPPSPNCTLATDKLRIFSSNDTGSIPLSQSFQIRLPRHEKGRVFF